MSKTNDARFLSLYHCELVPPTRDMCGPAGSLTQWLPVSDGLDRDKDMTPESQQLADQSPAWTYDDSHGLLQQKRAGNWK